MTNATNTPTPGDNIETHIAALRKELKALGSVEGNGNAARPDAGRRLVHAAFDGTIGEDDAPGLYADYAGGVASVAKRKPGAQSHGSEKAQISKFRTLIRAGALPKVDFRDVLSRMEAQHVAHTAADTKVQSLFQSMVAVAVEQLRQPDVPLSDEQIDERILIADNPDKSELDKMIAAYKSAHKLAQTIPSAQTEQARVAYRDWIVENGGDVPPMTKEEKAEAEALAFLSRKGMIAVHAIAQAAE